VRSYRAGDGSATRALAMATARLAPRLVARDVPAGLDVVHYPLTVPIPDARVPRVVTLHDVQHRELPQFFSPLERAYRRWAYDHAARSADQVITVSEHGRRAAIEQLGLDPARVTAIHWGIDHARFKPGPVADDEAALAPFDLPPRFVFYPANLWPHKNHAKLLDGLARASDMELALVLCGQAYGWLDRLDEHAAGLGIGGRVHHLGFVGASAVPALLRRARAVVFPSLYEGFGGPPLEAMACGCPVACSMAASLAEVCGDAALAFDPHDPDSIAAAIDSITADEAVRGRLRAAGLERARRFTWENAARRHSEVFAAAAA
jgi:glycosyltransferase involved in cell wall biosynthesis